MKEEDFIKAIDNLGSNVVIDEVKISLSKVREAHGHNNNIRIVWDANGRAYTSAIINTNTTASDYSMDLMNRDKVFDLVFE